MPGAVVSPAGSGVGFAPDRSRLRSSRIGSSAYLLRVSITANDASSTTAAASAATTLVSPQCDTPSGVVAAGLRGR